MPHPNQVLDPDVLDPARGDRDRARVAANMRDRLFSLGVPTYGSDSPDDLFRIVDTIERFEGAVRRAGGDLMVDEPPPGGRPQPDGHHRALPERGPGESSLLYVERIERAIERLADSGSDGDADVYSAADGDRGTGDGRTEM